MRVALNITREYLGGITTGNYSLLNFLEKAGKSTIGIEVNPKMHIRGATAFWHLNPDLFEQHIFNIHDLPIGNIIKKAKTLGEVEKFYRPIINKIKIVLKREVPDVILLNGTYYIPWMISIAAYELDIPIVLRYAGVLSKEVQWMSPKARKIFLAMERSFKKRVYSYMFPSQITRDIVEKEVYKSSIKRAYIIPNPVNIPDLLELRPPVDRRVAIVGRYTKIKNFDTFFKIDRILRNQKWNHESTFVTKVNGLKKFPKTINIMAPMRPEGLYEFYMSQGLIVSPSYFETFGNVPMEAACLGVPVLVSDQMGCAEILKLAGLSNMVMPFDNLHAVAERIKKLCGQQILPHQLNNLRKRLSPKLINEQILAVLKVTAKSV
ncbi:MAG: glycosyltransferase [Candidatus Parcubacteria bacterium]|nr:glycosyltransferase [Candidatus Parcubacteria bacterium]